MKHWTIAKQITLGGAVILALLILVSTVAVTALTRLEHYAGSRLRDDAIPGMVHISKITSDSLRGYIRLLMAEVSEDPAVRDDHFAKSDANIADASVSFEDYEKSITAEEDRKNFTELKTRRQAFWKERANFIALLKEGKRAEANAYEKERMEPAYFKFREQLTMMSKWNSDVGIEVATQMVATSQKARLVSSLIAGFSILAAIVLGWLMIRRINLALRGVSNVIQQGSEQVASAASQVSATSQSLAEGASEQAASLEETSSSLEEMASMAKRNADNVQEAKNLAGETRQAADTGTIDMREMKEAMDAIKASSDDVAKIIKTIDEIAFQTNILALNAAVEAARAGVAGAGFAVVADEVRNLAQRSAQSAKETAVKIEESIAKSEHGVRISEKVAVSLYAIAEKTRKVDSIVAEIASASNEQRQGVDQVNSAVSQMDKVTQSNASNAEEAAAAAEELNAQSITLKEAVAELSALAGSTSSVPPRTETPKITAPASKGHSWTKPLPRIPNKTKTLVAARNGGSQELTFKDM